jgi:hypothetical protein
MSAIDDRAVASRPDLPVAGAVASRAVVAVDNPARWAKQLASHLGRHTPPTDEDGGQRLHFAVGSCLLRCEDGALVLDAQAADPAGLRRVEEIVGSHLERFAAKLGLTVTWTAHR